MDDAVGDAESGNTAFHLPDYVGGGFHLHARGDPRMQPEEGGERPVPVRVQGMADGVEGDVAGDVVTGPMCGPPSTSEMKLT